MNGRVTVVDSYERPTALITELITESLLTPLNPSGFLFVSLFNVQQ